jgi:uncharacterized protein YgfB (UPF0149 family)
MTVLALFRRFNSNLRLFPTLALVFVIVAIASFSELSVLIGVASRSAILGVTAATSALLIEAITAFAIVLAISNNPQLFARAERIADLVANFGRGVAVENEEDEDETGDGRMTEDEMNEARLDQEDAADAQAEEASDAFEEAQDKEPEIQRCDDPACQLCNPDE